VKASAFVFLAPGSGVIASDDTRLRARRQEASSSRRDPLGKAANEPRDAAEV
jgi:hypothetical protein